MFSETTYSSQSKLIGQSFYIPEHGIGYLNLAFAANKRQKRPIFSFKPVKCLDWLEIQSLDIDIKKILIKKSFKKGNFHLAFMANKDKHLVLDTNALRSQNTDSIHNYQTFHH